MALTQAEKDVFDALIDGSNVDGLTLVEAELDGERAAVIVGTTAEDDEGTLLAPLAVMVDDALFLRLSPPSEEFVSLPVDESVEQREAAARAKANKEDAA